MFYRDMIRIEPDWNVKWEGQIVGFLEKYIRIEPDWNVKSFDKLSTDCGTRVLE